MKTRSTIGTLIATLSGASFHVTEGAQGLQGGGTIAALQSSHPIIMIALNCLGILLILGCCALIFSSTGRTPGKR